MNMVLAKTFFVRNVIVFVIVLLSFLPLDSGTVFGTICDTVCACFPNSFLTV